VGEGITLGEYSFTFDDLRMVDSPDDREAIGGVLSLYKNDEFLKKLYPRKEFFNSGMSVTLPGVRSTLEDDFYVILHEFEIGPTSSATFKVFHNPLINWLWIGTFVLLVGTTVAAWPHPEPQEIRKKSPMVRGTMKP
jgi:cytochrome c-type biogenesis protein CcmF